MSWRKIDPEKAHNDVKAVRRVMIIHRQVAAAYGISQNSIHGHIKGKVGVSFRVEARRVLTAEEENAM